MIEIITDFRVLMQLAGALGKAKQLGDIQAIEKAQAEHDAYRDLCLSADKMTIGLNHGDL